MKRLLFVAIVVMMSVVGMAVSSGVALFVWHAGSSVGATPSVFLSGTNVR